MIWVEVWTMNYGAEIQSKMVWAGDLNSPPQLADGICLGSDYCTEAIKDVTWMLDEGNPWVYVRLATFDRENVYPEFRVQS